MFLTFLYSRDFYFTGARESPSVEWSGIRFYSCSVHFLCFSKENEPKEKSPLLRNFLPYQAKTALSAPRRYRSCPSELPTAILNQGILESCNPLGMGI